MSAITIYFIVVVMGGQIFKSYESFDTYAACEAKRAELSADSNCMVEITSIAGPEQDG
jgi:uridylate kinase